MPVRKGVFISSVIQILKGNDMELSTPYSTVSGYEVKSADQIEIID